jgi:hypothetical protein
LPQPGPWPTGRRSSTTDSPRRINPPLRIAYLTSVTLPKTAEFAKVFQVVGTAGILAYSFSFIPNAIWFGAYKRTIVASIIDGIVYGALTGAIFAWRWPH